MARKGCAPVVHDHDAFLAKAGTKPGFVEAYDERADEYALIRQLLQARQRAGLTQEQVADAMGTTKSAVSRLESSVVHSPSVSTLRRYARAVGARVVIRIVIPRG